SFSTMNASIGERTHAEFLTVGGVGLRTGCHAQWLVCSLVKWGSSFFGSILTMIDLAPGHGAPILTHAVRSAISFAGSFIFGGICNVSLCRIAWMIRLSSGLPALSAGPERPPGSSAPNQSTRTVLFCI